jgi:hypothetical protein
MPISKEEAEVSERRLRDGDGDGVGAGAGGGREEMADTHTQCLRDEETQNRARGTDATLSKTLIHLSDEEPQIGFTLDESKKNTRSTTGHVGRSVMFENGKHCQGRKALVCDGDEGTNGWELLSSEGVDEDWDFLEEADKLRVSSWDGKKRMGFNEKWRLFLEGERVKREHSKGNVRGSDIN